MTNATLFLITELISNDEHWSLSTEQQLSKERGIENVQIIKATEELRAQITVFYALEHLSLDAVEKVIRESGAAIREMPVALQKPGTGAVDPYSASAIALPVEEELSKIEGVNGAAISPNGTIWIVLDPNFPNKQCLFIQIMNQVFRIKVEHQGFMDEGHS